MLRTPWMPLYCDDFVSSCSDMSCEEIGAYIRLLCHIWSRGPLPTDEAVIVRIAGCKKRIWKSISSRFSPCQRDDGTSGLSQTRLESERMKRQLRGEARSEAGKRGASVRWQSHGKADGKRIASHNHNHNSTSTVVIKTTERGAAPPFEGGGLPRLAIPDPAIDAAQANRAFLAAYRSKPK